MHRPLVPSLLAVLAAALAGALVWLGPGGVRQTPAPATVPPSATRASPALVRSTPSPPRAVQVLHAWDGRRAAAYASGSIDRLRALYAPGSAAGRADVRLLRRYLQRGLRVTGMRMQLLAVQVLDRSPGRLRLRVTDRLYGASAATAGSQLRLPRDQASTSVLELRRRDHTWRMVAVLRW